MACTSRKYGQYFVTPGGQGGAIEVLGLFLQKVNYTHPHTHTVHSGDLDHFTKDVEPAEAES